jgi:hypothetical protein
MYDFPALVFFDHELNVYEERNTGRLLFTSVKVRWALVLAQSSCVFSVLFNIRLPCK